MAKSIKTSEEQRLKAFFRDAIQGEPGIEQELAERMAERCVQSIEGVLSKKGQTRPTAGVAEPAAPAASKPFDPFAFSAVAVLAKRGRDELMAKLGEIEEPDHLRELALAQHIGVDPKLSRPDELRLAIVSGAERRIASRRAAAS